MPVPETDRTLTVDACVVNYHFQYVDAHSLPEGLPVKRMESFSRRVLANCPLAINDWMRAYYSEVLGDPERVKFWIMDRADHDLAREVDLVSIPREIKARLRTEYGRDRDWFNTDGKYIRTALNTASGCVVTENLKHFDTRPIRPRNSRKMGRYLRDKLGVNVLSIDTCCHWYDCTCSS